MKVKQKLKKKTGVGQMHHDADELMVGYMRLFYIVLGTSQS